MSKKIAEGTAALVLDVKVGGGAFMPDLPRARELARTMVGTARTTVRTAALLTDMLWTLPSGEPSGTRWRCARRSRCWRVGPPDVVEVTLALAGGDADAGRHRRRPVAALADGRAMDRWRRMIRPGGDPEAPLPVAPIVEGVRAQAAGVVEHIDAMAAASRRGVLGAAAPSAAIR